MPTTYSSAYTGAQIDDAIESLTTTPILRFTNKQVSTWTDLSSSDALYTMGYRKKAAISCTNVTTNHVPFVIFDYDELSSGNYAPYADTGAGIVYIYSKVASTITIPTILCV